MDLNLIHYFQMCATLSLFFPCLQNGDINTPLKESMGGRLNEVILGVGDENEDDDEERVDRAYPRWAMEHGTDRVNELR